MQKNELLLSSNRNNNDEKKSKKFDKKTKHKLRMDNKVKKEIADLIDYKRDLKSEKFEFYYKVKLYYNKGQFQKYFDNDKEFELFLQKLKEKLPSVFRINTANGYWKEFQKRLINSDFVNKYFQNEDTPFKIRIKNLTNQKEFSNIVFQMDVSRSDLKKKDNYKNFHKFILSSVASGLISRQEAVSMIPPMILDVKPNAHVFDMCAAPGSKTAQFLEIANMNYDYFDKDSIKNDTGFVLANDNNVDRAFLMTHQVKRLNTAGMVVTSHDAQGFPSLSNHKDEKILFDNILCDVPCSSDAAMRKLPHKWKSWSPRDSYSLHKLQLIILRRGISLLKVIRNLNTRKTVL